MLINGKQGVILLLVLGTVLVVLILVCYIDKSGKCCTSRMG